MTPAVPASAVAAVRIRHRGQRKKRIMAHAVPVRVIVAAVVGL